MAATDLHFIHGALHPCKRGVRFLGGATDDGVQVDAAITAIVAGNHTKGTFTCWLMVPDDTGTYCFFGAGDSAGANVEYTTFDVEAGTIKVMMRITTPTTTIDVNTAAGTIKAHKWHHIAIVQDGVGMKIYIDGEDMPLTWTVETDKGQWYLNMNAIDGAHIGCADSVAGAGALTEEFKGYISEVRIWSGTAAACALSEKDIAIVMNGGKPDSAYLHNSWDLEFDLNDDGTGADNGTGVGDINFSDANEFASRLTFLETTPLAADNVTIMADQGVGFAYSILAA